MKKTLLATLLLGSFTLGANMAWADDLATINVIGNAEIFVKPDTAKVKVGAICDAKTQDEARNCVEKSITAYHDALNKLGISDKDLVMQNISVNPSFHYDNGKREKVGYSASRYVLVTLNDLSKVGLVIYDAMQNGLDEVSHITYSLKDEGKVKEQARTIAIKDAMEKADAIAKGFDVKIKRIYRIDYENAYPTFKNFEADGVMPVMMSKGVSNGARNAIYIPEDLRVNDSVRVTYEIK